MKAHVFDLDGTLIDSMGIWIQIDHDLLTERGITIPANYDDYVNAIIPLPPLESAEYAIEFFGLKDITAQEVTKLWLSRAYEAYSSTIPLKLGAYGYLQRLQATGAKMAIATSSPSDLCMAALHNHKIEGFFDTICHSDEVGFGKDRPDVFLLTANRLSMRPEECILYDDSFIAIKTAKSIGMTTCAMYDKLAENSWADIKAISDHAIYDFEGALLC